MNPVPVRAIVADDEEVLQGHLIRKLTVQWPELEVVACASNGLEAADLIDRWKPRVAFLDIQMPGLSGLEVAQGIEGDTRVVFVTAFDAYAVEAFERQAVDYLLKPVSDERLALTCQRLKSELAKELPAPQLAELLRTLMRPDAAAAGAPLKWIRASSGSTTHHVPVSEVMYFQSDQKYTLVKTREAEHVIRMPLADLINQLDPAQFCQIHRSTIVNLDFVASTRRDDSARLFVHIRGMQVELPVSRAYVHSFKQM